MAKVEVDIYNKTQSHCSNCKVMGEVFEKWASQTTDKVTSFTMSAESNRDKLIELGAQSAPVYVVKRGSSTTVISGLNPDILVDALDGRDGLWDDLDSDCSL